MKRKKQTKRKRRGATQTRAVNREKSVRARRAASVSQADRQALAEQVLADMRRDASLTFSAVARTHGVDPRWVLKHLGSAFQKDSSGRIRARGTLRHSQTLYIPTATPGLSKPVATKNVGQRRLIGRWMDALNSAGRGDFSKMKKFPRKQVIGGVRLPTGPKEVQRILEALAEKEEPYEGLYRALARPS